jgi:TonB family protein
MRGTVGGWALLICLVGCAGTPGSEVPGAGRSEPETAGVAPTASGSARAAKGKIEPAEIQAIVRKAFKDFRGCYESALQRDPKAQGTVRIAFVIGPDGRVASAKVHDSTMADPQVGECLVPRFAALQFPAPRGGDRSVDVVYPIKFEPGDDAPAASTSASGATSVAPAPAAAP